MASAARERKFAEWMFRVDSYLEERIGVNSLDLPDLDYWDMFDWGVTAQSAADSAIIMARTL